MIIFQAANNIEETEAFLKQVLPDRIGHGTFLHPDVGGKEELLQTVHTHNIPLGKRAQISNQ